jgi:hypothetical protein
MSMNRKFYFPISTLIRDSKQLLAATVDVAARLAYPANKAAKDESVFVARNRYLLDEFPPRNREKPEDEETPPTT